MLALLADRFEFVFRMFRFKREGFPQWFWIIGPMYLSLIRSWRLFYLPLLGHLPPVVIIASSLGFSSILQKLSLSTKLSLNESLLESPGWLYWIILITILFSFIFFESDSLPYICMPITPALPTLRGPLYSSVKLSLEENYEWLGLALGFGIVIEGVGFKEDVFALLWTLRVALHYTCERLLLRWLL